MARINSLTNFLDDVATAIKQKTGDNTPIPASEFDTEILSIETAGTYQQKTLTITQNGQTTLTPDTGFDAMDQVEITVNVPIKQLQSKTVSVTSNGNVSLLPDTGYDGFNEVNLQVNVPTGGSGDVKLFATEQQMQADPNPQEGDLAVIYREETQPVQEDSEFSSCIFPNTVVLDSAFSGNINGSFRNTGSSYFNGMVDLSSSNFRFNSFGGTMIRVQYTSNDGITYTRTDGGEELQEFGTTIKWEPMGPWNDVIGNFMKIGGNYFEGLYEYKNNSWKLAPTQLTATSGYVYKQLLFYGKNGVENGTLGIPDNSFTDTTAKAVYEIQNQYENMEPRILTDTDKTINKKIYFIPVKRDGTPLLDTSNVTSMVYMFSSCSNLTTIPLLDTSNVTSMTYMFYGCSNLTTIPLLDTSNVTSMVYMFNSCSNLTSIPLLDTSNVINMGSMFSGCTSLTNESLNNILQMCINAVSYARTKTLKYIGLTQEQATTCQGLSNYQAFLDAGWTTGY